MEQLVLLFFLFVAFRSVIQSRNAAKTQKKPRTPETETPRRHAPDTHPPKKPGAQNFASLPSPQASAPQETSPFLTVIQPTVQGAHVHDPYEGSLGAVNTEGKAARKGGKPLAGKTTEGTTIEGKTTEGRGTEGSFSLEGRETMRHRLGTRLPLPANAGTAMPSHGLSAEALVRAVVMSEVLSTPRGLLP